MDVLASELYTHIHLLVIILISFFVCVLNHLRLNYRYYDTS